MVFQLSLVALAGLVADHLFRRVRVPGLVGMLLVGIAVGPFGLKVLGAETMRLSPELRRLALLVILLRAGLELSKDTLNRVGTRAVLMSCVPAIAEGVVLTLAAPPLLGLSYLDSAMLAAVLAAVSPAVVVPLMLQLQEQRRGTAKGIPTLIMAASSVDDVFVIVVFSSLLGMAKGERVNVWAKLAEVPVSLALGVGAGLAAGYLLLKMFRQFSPRATKQMLVALAISILLVHTEELLAGKVPFAGLLAVMAIGFYLFERSEEFAHKISAKLSKVWVLAEILLFVLVGAQVDVGVAWRAGLAGAALVALGLVGRSVGTYVCFLRSDLTLKERLFCVVAYVPKATVQAAIGAVPLAAGVPGGEVILAVAVLSIALTAPIGAWAIALLGERWLAPDELAQTAEQEFAPPRAAAGTE
ncbi:MAG: potassium transporter [Armatimonadetes bacterium CG_4_10_14_3_um_filter_66_18]|nr:sodium:proton antiporter [Armatimonadota bacterium]PIU92446.1 MAG: potassium transporter [Armatimonadetes bacterium CG06_land_8_20_14_3_00_66_21]PIX40206.1 MAG: potassium transporter [Armatimonadetes bacterium CG_4_8_14_3_um_filter_66_20]PIY34981.1 MAG: potassium transporter [Armatimonadetes bacterium CG_4_10_14_3_um_filter_66_18]PIZ36695.1 MAG: potassium transporter [Armatimonadetes bacterium CG_4_10_14_0_8_um_filter_66_14]